MIIRRMIIGRSFSTEITPLMRIGKALTIIPEEYKAFSTKLHQPRNSILLILNLSVLDSTAAADPQNDKVLQLTGKKFSAS